MRTAATAVYELTITLRSTQPPIWRRVQVPAGITLPRLHRVLQSAMGWTDSHLHQFEYDGALYGTPDPDLDLEIKSERSVRLNDLLHLPQERLVYEYDFGDSWHHEVQLDRVLEPDAGVTYPVCVAGALACPPEDCGGVSGYYGLLEVLQDPEHEEHENIQEFVGGSFDPAPFSVDDANARLAKSRAKVRR